MYTSISRVNIKDYCCSFSCWYSCSWCCFTYHGSGTWTCFQSELSSETM